MSRFLNPTGKSTYGLALCARCSRKFSLEDLQADPNFPALMVCRDDLDDYDPYRLAPRAEDPVALSFVRPDTSLATDPSGTISESGDVFIITESGEGYVLP